MARRKNRQGLVIPHSQEPPVGENLLAPGHGGIPNPTSPYARPLRTEAPTPPDPARSRTPESHAKKVTKHKKQTANWEAIQEKKGNAAHRRQEWERSDVGKARLQDATAYVKEQGGPDMPVGMIYGWKGWNDAESGIGPKHFDRQLPGMADPNAAPRPPQFEELSDITQAHVHDHLERHGTSLEQMIHDFGAQLDQAYLRADRNRFPRREADRMDALDRGEEPPDSGLHPHAMDFYSHGEPRKVIDQSAKELGIPQPVHAVMNALTSPSTFFKQTNAKTGEVRYPNNETAVHVVNHAQMGRSWQDITNQNPDNPEGPRYQGYHVNMQKAAKVMEQYMAGVPPTEWRGIPSKEHPEGKHVWGPKTGPYANSWSDTHPQFGVSDVHTGGGGFLPHLDTAKPVLLDKDGNPKLDTNGNPNRDKSDREKAIESIPFFHSAADYALREALRRRNLGSVREGQAAQWGEEQIQRKEAGTANHGPTEEQAYSRADTFHQTVHIHQGQGELF